MEVSLRDYLKTAYETEVNKYELRLVQSNIQRKLQEQPVFCSIIKEEKPDFSTISFFGCLGGGIAVVCFLLGLSSILSAKHEKYLAALLDRLGGWALIILAGFIVVVLLSVVRDEVSRNKLEQKKYDEAVQRNKMAKAKNQRIQTQYNNDMISLKAQADLVDNMLSDTQKTLDKIYSVGVVHSHYQNLVAISSIYEYIDTGMCDKLTGPHGAYEHYEYLSRLGAIVTRLDEISAKLDQIQRNQMMLYDAITRSNRLSERMIQELSATKKELERSNKTLDSIKSYEAESAEYNRIMASNTEYLKWATVVHVGTC